LPGQQHRSRRQTDDIEPSSGSGEAQDEPTGIEGKRRQGIALGRGQGQTINPEGRRSWPIEGPPGQDGRHFVQSRPGRSVRTAKGLKHGNRAGRRLEKRRAQTALAIPSPGQRHQLEIGQGIEPGRRQTIGGPGPPFGGQGAKRRFQTGPTGPRPPFAFKGRPRGIGQTDMAQPKPHGLPGDGHAGAKAIPGQDVGIGLGPQRRHDVPPGRPGGHPAARLDEQSKIPALFLRAARLFGKTPTCGGQRFGKTITAGANKVTKMEGHKTATRPNAISVSPLHYDFAIKWAKQIVPEISGKIFLHWLQQGMILQRCK